jgi:hypothetical protein
MAASNSVRRGFSCARRYSAVHILLRSLSSMQRDPVEDLRMAMAAGSPILPYMAL